MRDDEELAIRIRRVTQRETEEVEGKFRTAEAAARAQVQAMLVTEFGPDIRGNSDALGLMTDVDLAIILGDQDWGPGARRACDPPPVRGTLPAAGRGLSGHGRVSFERRVGG